MTETAIFYGVNYIMVHHQLMQTICANMFHELRTLIYDRDIKYQIKVKQVICVATIIMP